MITRNFVNNHGLESRKCIAGRNLSVTAARYQKFFFGEDFLLRRHDYAVNIAGGFPAAQLTSNYVTADGVRLPAKRS